MARILIERNLLNTRIGTLAIACAAVDDFAAWSLLTVVTAITRQSDSGLPLVWMLPVAAGYAVLLTGISLLLRRVSTRWKPGSLPNGAIAMLLVMALFSAAATEWMGFHSLIGAFAAGLATPRALGKELVAQLEPATVLLLIPIFFALTGIKANLLFTSGSGAYLDMLLILVVAVISKWGGAALTARWMGLPWPEALQLGLLVELIVLNVGLEAGVISGTLYSMLVFMAIVTTVMATPIIDWIRRRPKTLVRVSAG